MKNAKTTINCLGTSTDVDLLSPAWTHEFIASNRERLNRHVYMVFIGYMTMFALMFVVGVAIPNIGIELQLLAAGVLAVSTLALGVWLAGGTETPSDFNTIYDDTVIRDIERIASEHPDVNEHLSQIKKMGRGIIWREAKAYMDYSKSAINTRIVEQ